MGVLSWIMVAIWAALVLNGLHGLIKGYFYHEQKKAEQHEPTAYRKWVRLCGVFLMLGSGLNIYWCVLDAFSESSDFTYMLYLILTTAVVIALAGVFYACFVRPADKKAGIESEFSRRYHENLNKKS